MNLSISDSFGPVQATIERMRAEHQRLLDANRADRELADLAGSCDQLGIAVSGDRSVELEGLLHRTAEDGPDRPLAITFRPTGPDGDARAEAVSEVLASTRRFASSMPIQRFTTTDVAALAVVLR
jgi:hypothetical protein